MQKNRLLNLLKANAQADTKLRAEVKGDAAHIYLYDVIDAWFGVSAQMMVGTGNMYFINTTQLPDGMSNFELYTRGNGRFYTKRYVNGLFSLLANVS